jgi:hypothetical protein
VVLTYSIFGLVAGADCAIPGLVSSQSETAAVDLLIWLEPPPASPPQTSGAHAERLIFSSPELDKSGEPILRVTIAPEDGPYRMVYSDGAEFILDRRGAQVWVIRPDGMPLDYVATYLLGPVMGFTLSLRGITCLHASAIVIGDQAVALAGQASAGKSTTAAMFAEMGYPVLSDDILALGEQGGVLWAQPGYPGLRLWPDSVAALYGSPDALPQMTAAWDKRYLDLGGARPRFWPTPAPLAAVYMIGERKENILAPVIEPLTARAGLIELVANAYVTRLLDRDRHAQQFDRLSQVASTLPVRRVTPQADPAGLRDLCARIAGDFETIMQASTRASGSRHVQRG